MRGKKPNGNDYVWDVPKRNSMNAHAPSFHPHRPASAFQCPRSAQIASIPSEIYACVSLSWMEETPDGTDS